jgi:hypothetical protein
MARHCRHCAGDCRGECILPWDPELCIHSPVRRIPLREWPAMLRTRRFWRRVLWGTRA